MEVISKSSFPKALKATPKHIQEAVQEVIIKLANARSLETSGLDYTKMQQKKNENYYRIRVEIGE